MSDSGAGAAADDEEDDSSSKGGVAAAQGESLPAEVCTPHTRVKQLVRK